MVATTLSGAWLVAACTLIPIARAPSRHHRRAKPSKASDAVATTAATAATAAATTAAAAATTAAAAATTAAASATTAAAAAPRCPRRHRPRCH